MNQYSKFAAWYPSYYEAICILMCLDCKYIDRMWGEDPDDIDITGTTTFPCEKCGKNYTTIAVPHPVYKAFIDSGYHRNMEIDEFVRKLGVPLIKGKLQYEGIS